MNLALPTKLLLRLHSFLPTTPKCPFSAIPHPVALEPPANTSGPAFFTIKRTLGNQKNTDYEFSIIASLRECSSGLSVSLGQQYHCHIVKSGLDSNLFIQNSLISFYGKCGLISSAKDLFEKIGKLDLVSCNIMISGYVKSGHVSHARDLFDRMPEKNSVSYTSMIMGWAQHGFWNEAISVFLKMRFSGLVPNEVTMSSVISAFLHMGVGRVENARMLHGLVFKLGLGDFVHVSTNLLHAYCVGSCLADAKSFFNEMPDRNVVSWNVMLNGYAKAGLLDLALNIFERIEDKDMVSWGTVVDGYLKAGRLNEALTLYCQMLRTGLGPNDHMIVDIISACGDIMALKEGQLFHAVAAKRGFDCYDFIQATIIHFYAACREVNAAYLQFELGNKDHLANWNALIAGLMRNGMTDNARALFDGMSHRDLFSWSSMIAGYSQNEQPELALDLFHEMVNTGVKANEITMVSVLSAIASLGRLNEGRRAHEYICDNSLAMNDNLSAAVIDMYAKCGSIDNACKVFNQIRDKAFDVSPWNAIIGGLAMHGHAELALAIFSDLQRLNIKLNSITFIGVLTACCHAGLVEVGEEHFKRMKEVYNLEPNIKHYGCMVDLLSRAGRLEEAEELIRSMPMKADVVIWGTLLAASKTHGNMDLGKRAAQNLARLEPSHGPSRVLLSNVYADSGRWCDAFMVRQLMQNYGLTRSPAYSDIT